MLSELRIENFAIIQSLELHFQPGLITFTGETGAGKSIILDAITAVVGGKADATLVRAGAERALVEAHFHLPQEIRPAVEEILRREDLLDDPTELTLTREIRREGRSVGRINGRAVAQALLREVGALLVDIHGQSEHLSLLVVREHLRLLDRFAGTGDALQAYQAAYARLNEIRRELARLRAAEQDAERRSDLLAYQLNEIDSAGLKPGEEHDLRQERDRLANAEALASLAQKAAALLEEGEPETPSLSDLAGQVAQALRSIARLDASQNELSDQAAALVESAADLARALRDYLDGIEFNPRRLEQLEERIDLIHKLQRKYGGSIEAALAFAETARADLDAIAHATERIEALEKQETPALAELARCASALSAQRRAAARRLEESVERELADLSMAGARFAVGFQTAPDPAGLPQAEGSPLAFDATGVDRVEFLIAPNPGEGLKPLVKIASGGETSRLMLALKNTLTRADFVPTLIFDEIDQGIGGRVGVVVGEKLWQLGRRHAVLCVTHLPQLAAFGDQHFSVRKQVKEGRTNTEVRLLADPNRLEELAQMMGSLNETNRAAARESLAAARLRASQLNQSG